MADVRLWLLLSPLPLDDDMAVVADLGREPLAMIGPDISDDRIQSMHAGLLSAGEDRKVCSAIIR